MSDFMKFFRPFISLFFGFLNYFLIVLVSNLGFGITIGIENVEFVGLLFKDRMFLGLIFIFSQVAISSTMIGIFQRAGGRYASLCLIIPFSLLHLYKIFNYHEDFVSSFLVFLFLFQIL